MHIFRDSLDCRNTRHILGAYNDLLSLSLSRRFPRRWLPWGRFSHRNCLLQIPRRVFSKGVLNSILASREEFTGLGFALALALLYTKLLFLFRIFNLLQPNSLQFVLFALFLSAFRVFLLLPLASLFIVSLSPALILLSFGIISLLFQSFRFRLINSSLLLEQAPSLLIFHFLHLLAIIFLLETFSNFLRCSLSVLESLLPRLFQLLKVAFFLFSLLFRFLFFPFLFLFGLFLLIAALLLPIYFQFLDFFLSLSLRVLCLELFLIACVFLLILTVLDPFVYHFCVANLLLLFAPFSLLSNLV